MTTIHYPKNTPEMEAENAKGVWCGPDHVVDYAARRAGLVYDYGAKRIDTHKVEDGGELHTTNIPGLVGITEFGVASIAGSNGPFVNIAVTTWFKDERPIFEVTEYTAAGADEPHSTDIKTF